MKPIDGLSPGRQFSPVKRLDGVTAAESALVRDTAAKQVASQAAQPSSAPVDRARVEEIRSALRENRYPVTPMKIADALIAAKYMLVEKV